MTANQRQSEAWNGGEAVHYVDHADRYDRQLEPFADAMLERAALEPHHAVLDVGCGCGFTTLRAAATAGSALGVDISAPLIGVAADRARSAALDNVDFVVADAQTYVFVEGGFDVLISQFGLMFFDDPVAAFTNLGGALAPGGRLVFVCWQGLAANEWVTIVADAVARHVALGDLGRLGGGPGMFALEDPEETIGLLDAAGFGEVVIEPIAPTILLGGGGSLDESIDFLLGTGIARGLLGQIGDDGREEATDRVRASLEQRHEPGVGVRLGSGGWLVSGRTKSVPTG